MANKKAEILTMDGQVVSPITLATNVLLDDGRTAQDLLDSRDESMFSPTITTSSSISKVGQGDNVDFSENVIDGAYKSCVLKGKTLVNYNAEGNDRNEYVCMPSVEGSNLTVNGTVEGKVKSAILKGQTVNNLWANLANNVSVQEQTDDTIIEDYSEQYTRVTFGESQVNSATIVGIRTTQKLQVNNTYYINTFIFDALDVTDSFLIRDNSNHINLNTLKIEGYPPGQILSFTTQVETNYLIFYYFAHTRKYGAVNYGKPFYMPKRFIISDKLEDVVNQEFFEGMQSVKMPVLTTTGKNLFNPTKMIINDGALYGYYKYKNDESVKCTLSISDKDTSVDISNIYLGVSKIGINPNNGYDWLISNGKITRPSTMRIITNLNFISIYPNNIETLNKLTKRFNIQMEYGEVKTTYEPYKSNILTVNEPVELRGIGDVRDTLDLLTGELTQRIGEVVLDGSEDWRGANVGSSGTFMRFYTIVQDAYLNEQGSDILCDRFTSISHKNWDTDIEGIHSKKTAIHINIPTSKLESNDVLGFKKWLSSNPVTVCYKLATESVKTVDLSDNHVYSYKDTTHYTCSSEEGSLLPTLAIEEGVKYKAIIKPSTKYSIVFNRTEVASGLAVDLGGATANVVSTTLGKNIVQITTPSTLSHNYVIFKGLGNAIKDVQVIEGDMVGDELYFEGMVDVKNPSVMNCNTLHIEDENYKSNTISTNEVVLRSLPNGVCDTLDLETGEYVQRIGEREYQVGDESNSQVLTDKVNTQYELATPITTTIDLKQHPFAYKDGYVVLTSSSEEVSLTPTIEYSLIANRLGQIQSNQKLVEKQQTQIDELESMVVANLVNTQYQQALNEIKLGVK